ncbi:TolB family protein [Brachybacterium sp. FME24]|uniref:TolB family protein n=1 Tax=Brachybacterium sp. FME24 TaxID=2742605 RepID=UPI001867955A|nr:PD40 domain-containing protein [Brachybacterium sp. FME24]
MSDSVPWRTLQPGQRARIRIWDRASGEVRTVHESRERLYEAPNWTREGRLLVNGEGKLWFLPADGSAGPQLFDVPGLPPVNNDHVLTPDGTGVLASASDRHIWHVPFDGRRIRRVTSEDGIMHFLHGVSPDGTQLAYVRLDARGEHPWGSARIHTLGVDGHGDRAITTDPGPADGPAWTPDGRWILLNTEQFSTAPGHAQLARIRPDGTQLEQLTFDERVNWFPHVAPTGDVVVYVSFPPGTIGHPENRPVQLRLVDVGAWQEPTTLVELHGGQGTMNVPSWAPDGSAFAFVDYPE